MGQVPGKVIWHWSGPGAQQGLRVEQAWKEVQLLGAGGVTRGQQGSDPAHLQLSLRAFGAVGCQEAQTVEGDVR